MEFVDEGVVLSARAHGETNAVVEVFTSDHGRWAGLVYGGQGRKAQPLLQIGNSVRVEWKGRLEESLGHYSLELTDARAARSMSDRLELAALSSLCATALVCLPEREKQMQTYQAMTVILDNLEHVELWPALTARWEIGLLAAVGFGLTLDRCAASGSRDDLVYLSPKSGCAVSRKAGEPYKDKLLPLPGVLRGEGLGTDETEAILALKTTGYFLETRILHLAGQQLPEARQRIVDLLVERITNHAD